MLGKFFRRLKRGSDKGRGKNINKSCLRGKENSLTGFVALEEIIGYRFRDGRLLTNAVTHSTFAYEAQQEEGSDNQRLEFLGDSVLGMVVAEYVYNKYPHSAEGDLTQRRALLVNKSYLANKAKAMGLSQYLLLGKGEAKMHGRENPTNLCGALEAIIGAIYIDAGLEEARKFIMQKIV